MRQRLPHIVTVALEVAQDVAEDALVVRTGHAIGGALGDDHAGQRAEVADLFGGKIRVWHYRSPSVEQIGEALLDAVGDIERQRLDGRGRIDAARRDPDAA